MENLIKRSEQIIAFLISTTAYQGHSSLGERMSICVPQKSVQAIAELSIIIGRMLVYQTKEDKENFDYMVKFFDKTCDKHNVNLNEFKQWQYAEDEIESESDDNCEACTNG